MNTEDSKDIKYFPRKNVPAVRTESLKSHPFYIDFLIHMFRKRNEKYYCNSYHVLV